MWTARVAFLIACTAVGMVSMRDQVDQETRNQQQVRAPEDKETKPAPSPSAAELLKKYQFSVDPVVSPNPIWHGSEVALATLKERIRKAIREKEGRDINIENADIYSVNKGETAIGKISYESDRGEEIVIDTDPCKDVMSHFRRPYEKEDTGRKVKCGGKEFSVYAVEQK